MIEPLRGDEKAKRHPHPHSCIFPPTCREGLLLFFLPPLEGGSEREGVFAELHPFPLPSREREKERGVEGGNEFREKERKETIRGNSFPLILRKVFSSSVVLSLIFCFCLCFVFLVSGGL